MHRVLALAATLGTDIEMLLAEPPIPADDIDHPSLSADSDTLCALLVELNQMVGRDELAESLDWSLDRLHAAGRVLRTRLGDSGMYLQSTWGLRVRGNPKHVRPETLGALERAGAARRGLNLSTAALLSAVASNAVDADWERSATNPERVALGALLRMGHINKVEDGFALSDDVAYSLGLPPDA